MLVNPMVKIRSYADIKRGAIITHNIDETLLYHF